MNRKKMSRRDFLRATAAGGAGVLAAGSGLSALAQDAPTATPAPLPEGAAGKLTVIHRTEYFEQVQTLYRETVTAFAADNGVELDISTANPEAFGDFLGKMTAAVAAGNPPDLAYHTNISNHQMHLLGLVEDVTDVVDEAQSRYGQIMSGINADTGGFIDGGWRAIPFLAAGQGLFIRGDKLEEIGVDPASLRTWDDRRAATLAMSDPDGEFWGWGITANQSGDGFGFVTGFLASYGAHPTDETGQIVTFDSPEAVAAVEWLAETYNRDGAYGAMLPPGIESWGDISNNEAYLAGSIGYTHNAFSVYAQAKRDENPVYPVTMLLPEAFGPAEIDRSAGSTSGWMNIFKGAQNIELAKELALHMLSPEVFIPMSSLGAGLFMPAYENLWTDELIAADRNFAIVKAQVSVEDPFIGWTSPALPNALTDAIRPPGIIEAMVRNAVSGEMTAAEAVANCHQQIVDIFEEAGVMQP
jgi:multiple sugar transport system substrate-binding protein